MSLPVRRRAFLGGLLTLATAPAWGRASPQTPVEAVVEGIREARLAYLRGDSMGAPHRILLAIQPLHELRIPRQDRHRLIRLAFLMARRDHLLLGEPRDRPQPQSIVDLGVASIPTPSIRRLAC